jgi:hypothetical protein
VALVGLILESTVTRLAVEGYDRSARGVAAMENVVLAMMVINVVCLVLTWLIPNHMPPRDTKSEALDSGRPASDVAHSTGQPASRANEAHAMHVSGGKCR